MPQQHTPDPKLNEKIARFIAAAQERLARAG